MTKRTKAKRIEAWAAVFAETGSQCEQDSVFFEKESAAYVAKLYDARPTRVAHLVEADPLARLKEDVVRAARKVVEAERALWKVETNYPGPRKGWGPAIAHARVQLVAAREIQSAAVERLERKRR